MGTSYTFHIFIKSQEYRRVQVQCGNGLVSLDLSIQVVFQAKKTNKTELKLSHKKTIFSPVLN